MTIYRVTADLSGNTNFKFKSEIEADNEDQAWAIAYKSQLPRSIYNGKVEELPTRAELIAAHAALVEACKPIARLAKYYDGLDDGLIISIGTVDAESLNFTVGDLRNIAALLDGKG